MKRCIVYVRVSSEGQRENWSLGTQRDGCLAFAEGQGWTVIDIAEEVYTSTEYERPKLGEVLKRVDNGEVEVVLVYDQDRLARKQRQLSRILDELDETGAEVWSVRQGRFENDAMGVLMTGLRGFGSETENEQRTERTMRGQRARVEAGRMLGSAAKPTFGYRWPDDERDKNGRLLKHRYAVNPEEAAIVRQVYAWVLAGVSMRQIAARLNDTGIQSPYAGVGRYAVSGEWRHQTIKALVTNTQYRGEAVGLAQRRRIKGKSEKKRKHHEPVKLPQGVVPALISSSDWNRAQEIVAGRQLQRREVVNPEEVLLRGGIVRCGNCGRAMRLAKRKNGDRYYQCNRMSTETGECGKPSPSIKTSYIEEPVWALVRSVLLNPYTLHDRFHSQEQLDQEEALLVDLQRKHRDAEQRRRKLLRNLELLDDLDTLELKPRLGMLAAERDDLAGQIEALKRRIANREDERDRINRLLEWAWLEVERVDELTVEERKAILFELGVVVRVYPKSASERYTVEIGALYTGEDIFAGIDYGEIGEPTLAQRRETARLEREATERGYEAGLVEALIENPSSADGQYLTERWPGCFWAYGALKGNRRTPESVVYAVDGHDTKFVGAAGDGDGRGNTRRKNREGVSEHVDIPAANPGRLFPERHFLRFREQ